MESQTFGQRLQEARKARGYTQKHMAHLLRIHHSGYGAYEQDRAMPQANNLIKICDTLGIDNVRAFVTGNDYQPQPAAEPSHMQLAIHHMDKAIEILKG